MFSEDRYTDYDPWAWLYNESEAHLACRRLLPILKKSLLKHLPERSHILDLCCGTGQISQQFILRGHQVTGLDGSEKMLDYARENAPGGHFILGDARSFEFQTVFDAAVVTDSALNHIMSLEELKRVFQNVYNVLKEEGIFFFDLGLEKRYRNISINDGELKETYAWAVGETYDSNKEIGTFTITIFQPVQVDTSKQTTEFKLFIPRLQRFIYNNFLRYFKASIILQWVNKIWSSSEIVFSVKPYPRAAIESLLKEVGFTQISTYNFLGLKASKNTNQYAYFVARKPYQPPSTLANSAKDLSLSSKIKSSVSTA